MRRGKRIVVEILDDLMSELFGVHFLEPIQLEKTVTKVVPDIKSRRQHSVNPDNLTPINGPQNIRADQEIKKDEYDKIMYEQGGIFKRHPQQGFSSINPQSEENRKR